MTLAEAKKLAIRRQLRIHFVVREGLDAVINERGLAEVPGFRAIPDFNLEQTFAAAGTFRVEPANDPKARVQTMTLADLEKQLAQLSGVVDSGDHDE
jgi:hypothetical protein